jgi:hypothetical protein
MARHPAAVVEAGARFLAVPQAWKLATLEERVELAQTLIVHKGLFWDHEQKHIVAITPHAEFAPAFQLVLKRWRQEGETFYRPGEDSLPDATMPELRRPRTLDAAQERLITRLLQAGVSVREVANQLGLSRGVVWRAAQRYQDT